MFWQLELSKTSVQNQNFVGNSATLNHTQKWKITNVLSVCVLFNRFLLQSWCRHHFYKTFQAHTMHSDVDKTELVELEDTNLLRTNKLRTIHESAKASPETAYPYLLITNNIKIKWRITGLAYFRSTYHIFNLVPYKIANSSELCYCAVCCNHSIILAVTEKVDIS